MGIPLKVAQSLGIGHLHPAIAGVKELPAHIAEAIAAAKSTKPAPTKAPDDGLNKLERAFWERLQDAHRSGEFREVYEHPLKIRVIGNRWYHPDFMSVEDWGPKNPPTVTLWETKGFMREDAALKLIAAAERFPCFAWVLVTRKGRKWECRCVTARGISKDVWRPDWLL